MPLTLEEAKSLIVLGVEFPKNYLEQKAKAEEFETRRAKSAAAGSGKPAEWPHRKSFDDLLKRALDAAGKMQFDVAFKLLDEADQVLQQPDVSPGEKSFLEKWGPAKQVWLDSLETVNGQLEKVRAQMLATGDPDFKTIVDRGLPALTDNHKTPVMKAMFELDGGAGAARKDAALKAGVAIDSFRKHLNSFNLIKALDEHSNTAFGVPLTLRSELGKGLNALEQAIQILTAS